MLKSSFSRFIFVVLSTFALIFPVFSATFGDFEYSVSQDGTYILIDYYTGDGGDVIVPSHINDIPVTILSYNSFSENPDIISVTLPDTITDIWYGAFWDCTGLTKINIPNSVEFIDYDTFFNCTSLTEINIPGTVSDLYDIFDRCVNLKSVTLNEGTETLEPLLFEGCAKLEKINIPSSVTSIGYGAFYGCESLETFILPTTAKNIGGGIFNGCTNLKPITDENGKILSTKNFLILDEEIISYFGKAENIIIPANEDGVKITKIGDNAFYMNAFIQNVDIQDGIKRIGNRAFYDCNMLKNVKMEDSVTEIGTAAFLDCFQLKI